MSTPKGLREARSLVAYTASAKSYIPGYGLALDYKHAKDLVKIDQARVDRLLGNGESPERVAQLLLHQLASLSITTRRKFLKSAELLRAHRGPAYQIR